MNSQEYQDFRTCYFEDIRRSVEYSQQEILQIFSKYDKQILRELGHMALEAEKENTRIQAMKLFLTHSGLIRSQVQDKEYLELREMVEELTNSQEVGDIE